VRGPQDGAASTLVPRQQLTATPFVSSSNASISSAACAHDHISELWSASIGWPNAAFKVTNSASGPSIWGENSSGGNAIRGTSTGIGPDSIGLYGESATFRGVMGIDGGPDPDNSYGVFSQGDIYTSDDLTVADTLYVGGSADMRGLVTSYAGEISYVVNIAQNDDLVSLEAGDVVVISGVGTAVIGEIPLIKVRLATASEARAVIGVVDQHYVLPGDMVQMAEQAETKVEIASSYNEAILPGEYLTVVTLGAFKVIKVDASVTPVHMGDLLVASTKPGYAMASDDPKLGSVIGKALGECQSGTCLIPLMVTLK
jgi:hypothetical protein